MSPTVLAIDPGSTESGWVLIDADTRRPREFGKTINLDLIDLIDWRLGDASVAAIEMVASYGMAVGSDVFETCVWVGRFTEAIRRYRFDRAAPDLVKRHTVKVHHCHSAKASDANIRQALVDRFAPGEPNHGKGTKRLPGWFYGFRADVWQAYALAVYTADMLAVLDSPGVAIHVEPYDEQGA